MRVAWSGPLHALKDGIILHCNRDIEGPSLFSELAMLSVLTVKIPTPADEPQDRDPGILTLAFAVIRLLRRMGRMAFERRGHRVGETGSRG